MGVPTRFTRYMEPLHGLEAGIDVLEGTGEDMMNAGAAIGRWWAFIKGI